MTYKKHMICYVGLEEGSFRTMCGITDENCSENFYDDQSNTVDYGDIGATTCKRCIKAWEKDVELFKKSEQQVSRITPWEEINVPNSPSIGGKFWNIELNEDWFNCPKVLDAMTQDYLENIFTHTEEVPRDIVIQRYCIEQGNVLEDTSNPETNFCDNPDCYSCTTLKNFMNEPSS